MAPLLSALPSPLPYIRLLVLARLLQVCRAIPCHCQGEKCDGDECEGAWCLVGQKNSRMSFQACGEGEVWIPDICLKNFGEWAQVCACDTPYCNTFDFLHSKDREDRIKFVPDSSKGIFDDDKPVIFNSMGTGTGRKDGRGIFGSGGNSRTVHTVESTRTSKGGGGGGGGSTSTVIVVLIVVPLVVGSCALLVIAMNYYSGMG